MNGRLVMYMIGRVMQVESVLMLFPFITGLLYKEQDAFSFLEVAVVEFIIGFVLSIKKADSDSFHAREGYVTVALSWIVISLIGSVPFVLAGEINSIVDAIFETVSGFTTTGASILTDIEAMSKCCLFWRSFIIWVGGMGVLVFVMSVLPLMGAQNMYMMKAESPGPTVGKLVPKVKSTAAGLYRIYLGMSVVLFLLLILGKMDGFSALLMTFATAGTGGFGVLNSSCGDYTSYQQIVITIFMILFGVNFSVYYLIVTKKVKAALKCEEMRWYFAIILIAITFISLNLLITGNGYDGIADTVKHVSFTVGSIITTTGFSTVDFNEWTEFSKNILIMLMFFGACAGSTGGGLKVSRIVIYIKSVTKMISQYLHPKSVKAVMFEGKAVEHETIRGVNNYLLAFIGIFAISMFLISLDNYSFTTNFTAITATINNIGPGLNEVGPSGNFAGFSTLSKIVMACDMIIGRLEVYPILILLAPSTYKK